MTKDWASGSAKRGRQSTAATEEDEGDAVWLVLERARASAAVPAATAQHSWRIAAASIFIFRPGSSGAKGGGGGGGGVVAAAAAAAAA